MSAVGAPVVLVRRAAQRGCNSGPRRVCLAQTASSDTQCERARLVNERAAPSSTAEAPPMDFAVCRRAKRRRVHAAQAGAVVSSLRRPGDCLEAVRRAIRRPRQQVQRARRCGMCLGRDRSVWLAPMSRVRRVRPEPVFRSRERPCVLSKPEAIPVGGPSIQRAARRPAAMRLRSSAEGVTPRGHLREPCVRGIGSVPDDACTKPGGLCAGPLSKQFGLFDLGYCLPTCTGSNDCPTFGASVARGPVQKRIQGLLRQSRALP